MRLARHDVPLAATWDLGYQRRMPFFTIPQRLTMYYEQYGQGPDLVLIAGLSADHTVWSFVTEAFATRFRVTIFDNRGVGQSDAPTGPYSVAMMAQDTVGLLDGLGLDRAICLGHSMGGAITLQLCIAHPERVARAILCAPAARVPTPSRQHVESVVLLREAGIPPELLAATTMPWIFGETFLSDDSKTGLAVTAMVNNPYPQSIAAFRAQIAACLDADFEARLAEITTPTLIVAGREDLLTPLRCSETLHRGIRGAQLAILDCAHMVPIEQPDRFVTICREFLANV